MTAFGAVFVFIGMFLVCLCGVYIAVDEVVKRRRK